MTQTRELNKLREQTKYALRDVERDLSDAAYELRRKYGGTFSRNHEQRHLEARVNTLEGRRDVLVDQIKQLDRDIHRARQIDRERDQARQAEHELDREATAPNQPAAPTWNNTRTGQGAPQPSWPRTSPGQAGKRGSTWGRNRAPQRPHRRPKDRPTSSSQAAPTSRRETAMVLVLNLLALFGLIVAPVVGLFTSLATYLHWLTIIAAAQVGLTAVAHLAGPRQGPRSVSSGLRTVVLIAPCWYVIAWGMPRVFDHSADVGLFTWLATLFSALVVMGLPEKTPLFGDRIIAAAEAKSAAEKKAGSPPATS